MAKFNCSISSKYSKAILFSTLFLVLLLFSLLLKENIVLNSERKNLRRLDSVAAVEAVFTALSIFNYFYFPFLALSYCLTPCLLCLKDEEPEKDLMNKRMTFLGNKICYIINIGYLASSCINFIFGFQEKYSLAILICSSLYFISSSIFFITCCSEFKEKCFPGICEWKYIGNMYKAPCCFFIPCKNREDEKEMITEYCKSCEECCCGVCCLTAISEFCFITYITCYYFGLLIYSLFWLIGKFFVFISCCKCWLKEKFEAEDDDNFMFSKNKHIILDNEEDEEKKVKEIAEKLISKTDKKEIKKVAKSLESLLGIIKKSSQKK